MKTATLKQLIDRAGTLKAEVADRTAELDEIKDRLIKAGVKAAEGVLFRATISTTVRNLLDMEAVRAKLSDQFIKAHTTASSSTTLRVTARTAEEV